MPVSKAIRDLKAIPNIVAELGLAIAQAQKQLNIDYLDSLKALAAISKDVLGGAGPETRAFLEHLVKTAAPARYQFTETTLMVQLDLAESTDTATQIGGGFGMAGIVVNGSFASGRSSDYRAGAEVRTVIHAVLPQENEAAFKPLFERAAQLTIDTTKIENALDKNVLDAAKAAAEAAKVK